jgi:hypothetical protein
MLSLWNNFVLWSAVPEADVMPLRHVAWDQFYEFINIFIQQIGNKVENTNINTYIYLFMHENNRAIYFLDCMPPHI